MTTERQHTYLDTAQPRYLARPGATVYHELHSGRTPICGMALTGYRVTAAPAGRLCAACQKRRRAWAKAAGRLEVRG